MITKVIKIFFLFVYLIKDLVLINLIKHIIDIYNLFYLIFNIKHDYI